jgi:hypothetical protein
MNGSQDSRVASPERPRVSVIVPAYQAEQTLGQALDSVCAQTYPHWEAIVVNDGSTDRTAVIAQAFADRDSRIRVVTKANGGESSARNAGLDEARFEWVLFLDADDWISPEHLERMTDALSSDNTLDAVHCGSVRVALDGTHVSDGDLFPTLARRAAFPVHACIVRRRLIDAVGRFDVTLRRSPDWDLWQRIARTGARFGAARETLAFYRMQPNSASMDAPRLFIDGLRILRQGHAPDPRVKNPHPAHAAGAPTADLRGQEFYLLSWCAGLAIGSGRDAVPLVDLAGDVTYRELFPNAIAQCLFDASMLPTCRTPAAWEGAWPELGPAVEAYLSALEVRSGTPDLATLALLALKKMILATSPAWAPVVLGLEREKAELIEAVRARDEDRKRLEGHVWVRLGRRITVITDPANPWEHKGERS